MGTKDPDNSRVAIMVSNVTSHIELRMERLERAIQEHKDDVGMQQVLLMMVNEYRLLQDIWKYFFYDEDDNWFDLDERDE